MSTLTSSILASPFQLLEINLISAQDLAPVSKSIKAYAVAWVNPERKLTTQIDLDGHNNPIWNEKFVFRVDDEFLTAEDSAIIIEIYASAWIRDVLIGTVGVLLTNLLPPSVRANNRKSSKVRFVALQVRKPSGRPEGILNIGVNLVDATMRSMPMYSELSASEVGYYDILDPKKHKINQTPQQQYTKENNNAYDSKLFTLQRSQSEKNESTITDYTYNPSKVGYGDESQVGDSELNAPITKRGKIVNANGSLCSDVGPSPSVVAAAIAKGLYPMPLPMPRKPGNTIFEEWKQSHKEEGLKTKIERWGSTEQPLIYDHLGQNNIMKEKIITKGKGKNQKKPGRSGSGLFSCFGTAYGCEFSISCGGGNRKKKYEGSKARPTTASELTYDESYI
ncbi:hypothetical protein TanjilG_15518 [Lupinus angustifolius]|uniref:uncharacterized protein LOC109335948 n=1 Tax=Lupinus angustifolius TaxID=3871 RepID=UPI00090DD2CF|nr:PREDICTED: uncharacterized protein LOC109335948 [Lupinus angustifolius]OIV90785.1 hypothetical protein TanjilG_15518 [Lupinus angustifolius]